MPTRLSSLQLVRRTGLAQTERPMSQRVSYRLNEAAETAGIGLTKLREEIAAKRLRARKLGTRTIITRDDLVDWAARLRPPHSRARLYANRRRSPLALEMA